WTGFDTNHSPTAKSTELDPPLPRPPFSEYTPTIMRTLTENQDLFKFVTPINIDVFESLLARYPNQPFVRSVLDGLQ
ncbi:hypothetical protein B0H13DRAFT_1512364, partial [Mycena leptocephala]